MSKATAQKTAKRGRRPASPLEKAAKRVAKAYQDLQGVNRELEQLLSLSRPSNPTKRDKEVLEIAEERIKICERLDVVLFDVRALQRSKSRTPAEDSLLNELKQERDESYAKLREIPEIGSTHAEWAELSKEDKSLGIGRPQVPVELRLVRARQEFRNAESEYRREERKENIPPKDISSLASTVEVSYPGAGRPTGGIATRLSKSLRLLDKKIEHITSGRAEQEMKEKLKNQIVTENGERLGRPFQDLDERLRSLQEKRRELVKQIKAAEDAMPMFEWLSRQIYLKNKEIKEQVELLDENNLDPEVDVNNPLVRELFKLEKQRDALAQQRAAMREGDQQAAGEHERETPEVIRKRAAQAQAKKLMAAREVIAEEVKSKKPVVEPETDAIKRVLAAVRKSSA